MKYGWLCFSLISLLGAAASADPVYKRTQVTFSVPFEVPGVVLPAGTYVMKLLDPYMNRNIVQFYDRDQKHMYAMVFTVPTYRLDAPDHTVITFEERAGNSPQAIKEWIPAGDNWGAEFVYPQAHSAPAVEVASAAPATPSRAPVAATPQRPAPPQPVTQAPQRQPVQIAQAQPAPARSTPAPTAAPAPPAPSPKKELPKTASDLPLAALIGGLVFTAGACLRRRHA
jgi:hypothetical protein